MYFLSLLLLIEAALFSASESVLSISVASTNATINAINIMATQKTKHAQEVIHKYYERIVKNSSLRSAEIVAAYSNKNTIDEYVIMLLVDRWKDQGLFECLELLYGVRFQWWHIAPLRNKIISVIEARHKKFRCVRLEYLGKDDLREYCRMIMCYSFCKCTICGIAIPDMLRDKRVVIDFTHYPGMGHQVPMASRVCDYGLMALMAMYQVDVSVVSRSYGYPLIFNNRPGSPQKQVEAAFDAMIADIDTLRARFFR